MKTLYEKIWEAHAILEGDDGQTLLHVARHLAHDGSSHAFEFLKDRGLSVRRPDQVFATPDHGVSTRSHDVSSITDADQRRVVELLTQNTKKFGIVHFALNDARQGIVHVVGPEQGITQPGMVLLCGDSHTSTHGALGALAFGAGASEITHVLATQTTWQRRAKTMRVGVEGKLPPGVTAKDVILAIIARIGAGGAAGHAVEYAGSTIRGLSMEGRFTICNMSIEAGARAGMVAPDETTFAYLAGRPYAPKGPDWDRSVEQWKQLASSPDSKFDKEVKVDAMQLAPMVTWGTSPENALPIDGRVPAPTSESMARALEYMDLEPGTALTDIAIDRVFIGSCTNARIEDLRSAAAVVRGRKVAARVEAWVVPGSGMVKAQAEAEGLDLVFREAGFQWRHAGCSMCLGTNGDLVAPGQRCASTSNRNFAGRQGPGARTHLMSPAMAAAAALSGKLADVRRLA